MQCIVKWVTCVPVLFERNLHGNTYPEECREAKSIKSNLEIFRFTADNLDYVVIKSSLFYLETKQYNSNG